MFGSFNCDKRCSACAYAGLRIKIFIGRKVVPYNDLFIYLFHYRLSAKFYCIWSSSCERVIIFFKLFHSSVSLLSVKKSQEVPRSDKKCQEASRTYFRFILSLKCYILTKYDISHISNIIYWPFYILKGNNCHSETSASVDGASGILDPASRHFFKD